MRKFTKFVVKVKISQVVELVVGTLRILLLIVFTPTYWNKLSIRYDHNT